MNAFYENLGLSKDINIHLNSESHLLIQESIRKGQGKLDKNGALVVKTGKHTGRSANDRYIVKSPTTENTVWWENNLSPMTPENFAKLQAKIVDYHNQHKELFVTERSVGAHETHNISARLVTTHPHHALFSQHMFRHKIREWKDGDFTILHAPELTIDPSEFNTRSETAIVTCFDTKYNSYRWFTRYAGEIKKSMFQS
jgi:phosphoenolpyruvate carboxykinase (ATP)